MNAALYVKGMHREAVYWTFNGVELNTDMQYHGDIWPQYTELTGLIAN